MGTWFQTGIAPAARASTPATTRPATFPILAHLIGLRVTAWPCRHLLPNKRGKVQVSSVSPRSEADRVRRPAGSPLTRWPQGGRSGARTTAMRCTGTGWACEPLDLGALRACGPACAGRASEGRVRRGTPGPAPRSGAA